MSKKVAVLFFMFSFLLFGFVVKDLQANSGKYKYVWVSNLRVRQMPTFKEAIGFVKEGARVEILGPKSAKAITVTLRGKKLTAHFFKVRTRLGWVGWVFGGALQDKPVVSKNYKKRVISKMDKAVKVLDSRRDAVVDDLRPLSLDGNSRLISNFIVNKKKVVLLKSTSSSDSSKKYYRRGKMEYYLGVSTWTYYVNRFSKLKNGLRPGISLNRARVIMGKPAYQNATVLAYQDNGNQKFGFYQQVVLFFKNGKLLGIIAMSDSKDEGTYGK